jgi:hypothetical protein
MTHGRVDASDLHRAGLVQAVAALDAYIQGVVLDRAVDILLSHRTTLRSTAKVGLHFNAIQQLLLSASNPVDLELTARTHVAQRLASETFQKPNDIASALALVGINRLWSTAFSADPSTAKTTLGLVVDRRNRIVHGCDADPLTPGTVTPLSASDALSAIGTVEATVAGIEAVC